MDIQSLRLQISDSDCNTMVRKLMPPESPLEDLSIQIQPDGICVTGVYPILVNVTFESWWQLGVQQGKLSATLVRLKAFGMPAMVFKSAVLKVLREISAKQLWLEVIGEVVLVDCEALVSRELCATRLALSRATCGAGTLVIEAGGG